MEMDECSKLELPPATIELVIKHLPAVVTCTVYVASKSIFFSTVPWFFSNTVFLKKWVFCRLAHLNYTYHFKTGVCPRARWVARFGTITNYLKEKNLGTVCLSTSSLAPHRCAAH